MKNKLYFKNLNAFRFIAATLVILSHIELFKKRVGLQNVWDTPFFFEAGSAGVDFFFVLSGFLITTLLLKEQKETSTIDIGKFYLRRIFRIWPLYYLVLILCYFVVPYISAFYITGYTEGIHEGFWSKFTYSVFFMPNAALAFFKDIPYAGPLWSIGVEEQFYLFWPILVAFFPKKIRMVVVFILICIAIKVGLVGARSNLQMDPILFDKIKDFFVATRMECMGIGGLGALLYFTKHKIAGLLKSNFALLVSLALLPFVLIYAKKLFELHHIILGVLFLIIILNAATNDRTPIKLENRVFFVLGNISYGIYLWHSLCIGFILNLLRSNDMLLEQWGLFNVLLYVCVFSLSILVSWLSYKYIEAPFLKMKSKFSVITSGTEAATIKAKL